MYTAIANGKVTLILLSQVRLDLGGQGMIKTAKKTGGKAVDHYNIITLKLAKQSIKGALWPWAISSEADTPPKSYPVIIKLDKAKMEDRYDGNEIVMLFYRGKFERKINILNVAKQVKLFDGKKVTYKKKIIDTETNEISYVDETIKASGFKDMYMNKINDEALNYLESQLISEYTKLVQFGDDVNIEPVIEISDTTINEE